MADESGTGTGTGTGTGEKQMSIYGLQYVNPGEADGRYKETVRNELKLNNNHKVNRDNVYKAPQEKFTYFSTDKLAHERTSVYDQIFRVRDSYNPKSHRDDRECTIGLDVHAEEAKRIVPILSSSNYGRRIDQPFEDPSRKYVRIEHVIKGFYRNRGMGISHEEMHK